MVIVEISGFFKIFEVQGFLFALVVKSRFLGNPDKFKQKYNKHST